MVIMQLFCGGFEWTDLGTKSDLCMSSLQRVCLNGCMLIVLQMTWIIPLPSLWVALKPNGDAFIFYLKHLPKRWPSSQDSYNPSILFFWLDSKQQEFPLPQCAFISLLLSGRMSLNWLLIWLPIPWIWCCIIIIIIIMIIFISLSQVKTNSL